MAVLNKNLARWYREVSQHLTAGIPLPRALETAGGVPARDRRRMAAQLLAGDPLDTVLERARGWLPEVDRNVLAAAAHSGQLVETLRVLSSQRGFASRQAGKAAGAVVYPLFVMHVAILILPIFIVGIEDPPAYLRMILYMIVPLWLIIISLLWSVRRRYRWVGAIMRLMPLLRGYRQSRALADICFTLRAYLAAGETIDVAWFGAARASGDRRLQRLGETIAEKARLGTPPSKEIGQTRHLPEEFISLYQAGELTGQLEENLDHLWGLYDERAANKLTAASFWYPMLLVLAVAISIGYFIITAYAAYLESIMEMM